MGSVYVATCYLHLGTYHLPVKGPFACHGRRIGHHAERSQVQGEGKDPIINSICMEIALLFAPNGAELEAVHLWSEVNDVADDLSRLAEGAPLPEVCRPTKVARSAPRRDGFRVLGRECFVPLVQGVMRRLSAAGTGRGPDL